MISTEKPGSPEEILEHVGVKGMRWGVRKSDSGSSSTSTTKTPMSKKKKVAIGAGVTAAALGTAFVAYKLRSNHNTKVSMIKEAAEIKRGKEAIRKSAEFAWKKKANTVRTADREHYIKLMMSSKKYAPTLEEATRIANETYGRL